MAAGDIVVVETTSVPLTAFEEYRDSLDKLQDSDTGLSAKAVEALDKAGDALAFVEALWAAMGQPVTEEPDMATMEAIYDAYHGELAAAAMFLSENTFARVPDMLRAVSAQVEKTNDGSVPVVMVKGFRRFATRIEHTRRKKHEIANALREIDTEVGKTT